MPRHCDFSYFSNWLPSAILDLLYVCLDHLQRVFGDLYHCAKFGYIRCSSFNNMLVSIFCSLGLICLFTSSKFGVLGYSPQYWQQYQNNPIKTIPCAETCHKMYRWLKSIHGCRLGAINNDSPTFSIGLTTPTNLWVICTPSNTSNT